MGDSASSSTSGHRRLRYRVKNCNCNVCADIKITESAPNRGRLYYVCKFKRCGFWHWCHPIDEDVVGSYAFEPISGELANPEDRTSSGQYGNNRSDYQMNSTFRVPGSIMGHTECNCRLFKWIGFGIVVYLSLISVFILVAIAKYMV